MEIGGDRRIGRLLHRTPRPAPRDFDPLACLLPDRPDGDLVVLAQILEVLGDLGTLLLADRRDAGAHRRWVEGIGVEAGFVERPVMAGTTALSKGVRGCGRPAARGRIGAGLPWQSTR
jgi:hypothetical protein